MPSAVVLARERISVPPEVLPPSVDVKDWWVEKPEIGPWAKRFFKEYVGITDQDELAKHLCSIRELAWDVFHYRCIASLLFVNYNLSEAYGTEWYYDVLQRLKKGDKVLDVGCAFGQIARNFVFDGAPAENVWSMDLREAFWDLGYDMYKDRDTFKTPFFEGDISDHEFMKEYDGKFDFIHAASFFHIFNLESQYKVVQRMTKLLSSKPGSVIFGRQVGCSVPRHFSSHPIRLGKGLYMHSVQSFTDMFEDAAPGKWDIQAWLTTRNPRPESKEKGRPGRLRFIITRLESDEVDVTGGDGDVSNLEKQLEETVISDLGDNVGAAKTA